jgi:hypothetical protein
MAWIGSMLIPGADDRAGNYRIGADGRHRAGLAVQLTRVISLDSR